MPSLSVWWWLLSHMISECMKLCFFLLNITPEKFLCWTKSKVCWLVVVAFLFRFLNVCFYLFIYILDNQLSVGSSQTMCEVTCCVKICICTYLAFVLVFRLTSFVVFLKLTISSSFLVLDSASDSATGAHGKWFHLSMCLLTYLITHLLTDEVAHSGSLGSL